ncbi:MAG TPA: hypothetical protein P5548_01020 [Candidatus Moranbacteria bacterium]|nr:hypothetical protein [Candidatus Moranbacteria bacterium]HRZ33472.1 hypothetical protein [Candidatus Moranbacteria bacterium]
MEENTQKTEAPKQESQEQAKKSAPASEPKVEQKSVKGDISQFEAFLEEYLVKKAPFAIPAGGKEFIVKVAPYLIIIFAIIAIPGILLALGLSTVLAPFAMVGYAIGHGFGFLALISLVISIVVVVMELIAVPGLFKRTKGGWKLVFYASIVSLIGSIISVAGIISGIIGAIIGWYILFQVKELYKN